MSFAKIDVCIVCEGIRPELNNKHLIFGYFGIAPYVTIRLVDVRQPATLCFIFSGGPSATGPHDIRLRLTDPTGREITDEKNSPPIKGALAPTEKGGTNIFLSFQGALGMTGTFRVGLVVDGKEEYSTTVGFEQAIPQHSFVH